MRLYLDEIPSPPVLYVEQDAMFDVIHEGHGVRDRVYTVPARAVEIPLPDDAAAWAWTQIENVKMSKAARKGILDALGLEDV